MNFFTVKLNLKTLPINAHFEGKLTATKTIVLGFVCDDDSHTFIKRFGKKNNGLSQNRLNNLRSRLYEMNAWEFCY